MKYLSSNLTINPIYKQTHFFKTFKNSLTMKKLIITGMLFVAFLFTQNSNAQKVEAGLVIGTGFSELIGDNAIGYNKQSFSAGVQTDVHLTPGLALSSGLVYTQKGSKISEKFQQNSTFPAHTTLNYIQAPLMLKVKSEYGLFFSGGLTVGRLLSANLESFNGEKGTIDLIEDQFNAWEFGAAAQFGYKISPTLQVAGGWAQSVNNIFSGEIEGKNALQNNQFNVQLTFFPFSK